MTDVLGLPYFFVTYALIQSVALLLLIRFLDLYEREPLAILALMAAWGATGAVALSLIGNGIVLAALPPAVEAVFGPAIAAPLVEETAKGLALVGAFLVSYPAARWFGALELEGVTDGIVYGAAVGLGFAFTEDFLYLLNTAAERGLEAGLETYRSRVDLPGAGQLGHAVYTGTFGAGLGLATWSRGWPRRAGFALLGLSAAVLMHALHNGLVSLTLVSRFGFGATADALSGRSVPAGVFERMQAVREDALLLTGVLEYVFLALFLAGVALWVLYQRAVIREELAGEKDSGLISREEWELMPRYRARSALYWRLLRDRKVERWRHLRRVHNEMVDLAFLKRRIKQAGADPGPLRKKRLRIAALKSQRVIE